MKPLRIETIKVLSGLLRSMCNKLPSDNDWQRKQVREEYEVYRAGADEDADVEFEIEVLTPNS